MRIWWFWLEKMWRLVESEKGADAMERVYLLCKGPAERKIETKVMVKYIFVERPLPSVINVASATGADATGSFGVVLAALRDLKENLCFGVYSARRLFSSSVRVLIC